MQYTNLYNKTTNMHSSWKLITGTVWSSKLTEMRAAEDLTKYYPKIGSKVKSIKLHDTRTLNRAR